MNKPVFLITGATGFLGGAIVAQLLAEGRVADLRLLVRAGSPEQGLERVADQLRLMEVTPEQLASLTTDNIVLGDLGETGWIDDARLAPVTTVINCAAIASFGNNPNIWTVNVDDTLNFARAVATLPQLHRFLHVGTAMACGIQAESPVTECYESETQAQHLVPYTLSKATIEARIREELPNLPFVVARPSIVVGHTRLGCKPSSSIFWTFRMAKALGEFMCDYEDTIDVIPVDWCASALIQLAEKPELQWSRYHISAGKASACQIRDIDEGLSKAMNVPLATNYKCVDYGHLYERRAEFAELFGGANPKSILNAIKLYGGFSALNFLFDNTRLLAEGIAPAPRLTEYLGVCVQTTEGKAIGDLMRVDFK